MLFIKVLLIKEAYNVVLQSSKHEVMTFLREFIFAFVPHFIGRYCQKMLSKVGGSEKNT